MSQDESGLISPDEPKTGMRNRTATVVVVVVAVVLLVAAVAIVPHFTSGNSSTDVQPQLATAAIQSFPVTVTGGGTVVPASEIGVNFSTAGTLAQIDVSQGQKVTQGTVLARLNSATATSDVARAQAAVATANAALLAAQSPLTPALSVQLHSTLSSDQAVYNETVESVQTTNTEDASLVADANQQLTADGCSVSQPSNASICQSALTLLQTDEATAQSDKSNGQLRISQAQSQVASANTALQTASTPNPGNVATAQAGVSAANAELQAAQDEVATTTLVAPSAGTIFEVNGQIGENVTGSATGVQTLPGTNAPIPPQTSGAGAAATTPGTEPFIVLGTNGSFVIGATFPATDVSELSAHQTGTITAVSLSGLSLPCHVLAVAQDSTVVNGSPVVYASIIPDIASSQLSAGMAVSVSLSVTQANSVLAIPQSAIFLLAGTPNVDVWSGKRSVATAVKTGMQGTTLVQITSGLTAGEQVVLSAYQGLPQTATSVAGS
jgi:multidrug efflux pump subunit AcrA (membrane-fusion protein)